MSSPVLVDRAGSPVWLGLSNKRKGQLVALDPATGEDVWEGEGRFAESASLVAVGNDVLALTVDGELVVLRWSDAAGPAAADSAAADPADPRAADAGGLTEVARYRVADEAVWPHLAVSGDVLLVRSAGNLRAWRWPG